MKVPYAQSVHGEDEIKAVVEVLRGNTALGPKANLFEKKIAEMFGKKYGVMVNSGSSANLLAFEVIDLKPGDEVITPLLTFGTVVAPIIQKGLVPVFIDIDPDTYIVNPEAVEKAVGPKTRVLMIPSLLGNIPNLEALKEIAYKHRLWLVEDSCDTLGGLFKGKPTGEYSHITTTSFYGSHIINGAGGGGMVMVHDSALAERLVVLRGWGRRSSLYGENAASELLENRFNVELDGIEYDNKFIFSEIGYNFLPLELQAAFALVQIEKLPEFSRARKQYYTDLVEFFKRYEKYFILPKQTENTETNWLAFPIIIRDDAPFNRKQFATFLENKGIQTRPIFTGNVLKQPAFKNIPHRLAQNAYPNTDQVMRGGMVFACHQGLTRDQREYVKECVNEFISSH